tara:strand:- start:708 stop:1445 length:738 start_codon:yes stop_codon:yes gene_type:complete
MNFNKEYFIENFKTLFYALIIAIVIRSFFFQPFYIPSSSMETTLLVGDRLFVSKYSYGISKHSFPFSPKIFEGRIFFKSPKRGDVVVFKTPSDNRTDYIKRLIGIPGDNIQFIDGDLYLNNKKVYKNKIQTSKKVNCGNSIFESITYEENLTSSVKYKAVYRKNGTFQNSDKFTVPIDHFFFLGDNRDCSKDSRFLASVGYVHKENLVGKAQIIFFSSNYKVGNIFQFWKWHKTIRVNRFFKPIR